MMIPGTKTISSALLKYRQFRKFGLFICDVKAKFQPNINVEYLRVGFVYLAPSEFFLLFGFPFLVQLLSSATDIKEVNPFSSVGF